MQPNGIDKLCGLAGMAALVAGLTFLVTKWPQSKHMTFSQHAAAYRHTILYYIALFSIVLPLLVLFFVGWFVPAFHLSVWFSLCIVVSSLAQFACTLIPEVGGRKTQYHQLLAGVSAILLLPPIALLLMTGNLSLLGKSVVAFGLLIMFAVVGVISLNANKKQHLLWLQASYFAAFLLPILLVSYW